MPYENASWISQLNANYPNSTDPVSEGASHLNEIKRSILNSFPNTTVGVPWSTTSPVGVGTPTLPNHAVPLSMLPAAGKMPIGYPFIWLYDTLPDADHFDLEGQLLSRTTYPALFALMGTTYGSTTASNFKLPDMRGLFLRVQADGAATDPDRTTRTDRGDGQGGDKVGTKQGFALQNIIGTMGASLRTLTGGTFTGAFKKHTTTAAVAAGGSSNQADGFDFDASLSATTSSETRPINIYVRMIIRAK
jgi:microcystin-dependent protein